VISGGLAGFLPIGLFVVSSYQAPDLREADFTSSLIGLGLFLLFTFGAMLFGHFGALFAADSAGVWKNLKQELEYKQSRQVVAESFGGKSDDLSHVAHGPFQFRIQHLMIGMVLCSCVFALDQMFVNHSLLIALAIYIVLQAILLLGDWLYFKRYRNHLLGA